MKKTLSSLIGTLVLLASFAAKADLPALDNHEMAHAQDKNKAFGKLILAEPVAIGNYTLRSGMDWVEITQILKSLASECKKQAVCRGNSQPKFFGLLSDMKLTYFMNEYIPQALNHSAILVCGKTIQDNCSLKPYQNKPILQIDGVLQFYVHRMIAIEMDGFDPYQY